MQPDYSKEHTKHIFKSNNLLTVRNLYNYYTLTELYKVLKFRTPYSIFSKFLMSDRKNLLILSKLKLDKRKCQFFFNAAVKWNQINRFLIDPYEIKLHHSHYTNSEIDEVTTLNYDLSLTISKLKTKLKDIIMAIQCHGDSNEWLYSNFELTTYTNIVVHST